MEKMPTRERVLAFHLANEITSEEMEQVVGGAKNGTHWRTDRETMGGRDKTYDSEYD